jgi:aldose 1-epimerase
MSAAEVIRVRSDELEVELLPAVGGRLHRLRAFGVDLLATPDDLAAYRSEPVFWGAFVMAPWCNRASAGPATLRGTPIDLVANFADGTAIHGLVAEVPWRVLGDGRLAVERADDEHWPWRFSVSADVTVEGASLRLDYRLHNLSARPMPGGLGLHPWFRQPLELRVPAASVYRHNTGSSPEPEPAAGPYDLRRGGVPAAGLDGTWTELGDPVIEIGWPSLGVRGRLVMEAPSLHVAVATPDRDAWAVEPQTHGPDPLRRLASGQSGSPALLEPGDELRLAIALSVARAGAAVPAGAGG